MKKILTLSFIALLAISSNAQSSLDSSIINSYSKTVVAKVYDIANRTTLSISTQQDVANLFADEEDELYNLALNNATTFVMDSIKNNYKKQLHLILTAQQLNEYYRISIEIKANTNAQQVASMLQAKYNVDATMKQYFQSIIYWREKALETIWQQETNATTRNNKLANTYYVYDSLLSIYTNVSASSQYFSSRVYNLDSINPIDTNTKKDFAEKYYSTAMNNIYLSYPEIFNATFNNIFNQVKDTPYYNYLYHNEIYITALNNTTNAVANYINRDKISMQVAQQLTPIVLQREKIIAVLNKIYPTYTQAKDSIIDTLTYAYQSQINNFIQSSSALVNPSQIDLALYYATQLNLSAEQITSLQTALAQLNSNRASFKETNPMIEYDSKAYESSILNEVLQAEQYTQILTTKYYSTATNMANRIWFELGKAKLRDNLPEGDTKTELTNYYLAIIIAHYRNANNPEVQYSSIASIRELMPQYLNSLINQWNYSIPYNDTPDTFFQW